jgi:hypothetical protein
VDGGKTAKCAITVKKLTARNIMEEAVKPQSSAAIAVIPGKEDASPKHEATPGGSNRTSGDDLAGQLAEAIGIAAIVAALYAFCVNYLGMSEDVAYGVVLGLVVIGLVTFGPIYLLIKYLSGILHALVGSSFVWPIDDNSTSSVNKSKFGFRVFSSNGQSSGTIHRNFHTGIDMPVTLVPVYAAASGKVVYSERDYTYGKGEFITIKHYSNHHSRYQHLNSRSVSKGDSVELRDPIGITGNSGGVPYHLHFEIYRDSTNFINPLREYGEEDIRSCANLGDNPNPNPVYVAKNGKYVYNTEFKWNYKTDSQNGYRYDYTGWDFTTGTTNPYYCGHVHSY